MPRVALQRSRLILSAIPFNKTIALNPLCTESWGSTHNFVAELHVGLFFNKSRYVLEENQSVKDPLGITSIVWF